MKYTADTESIRKHDVPEWYNDAKLGIFIHWGLFSVPAFAVTGMNIVEVGQKMGVEEYFRNNPYAEWYLNTLRIPDSPTQEYHTKTYGKEFSYDDFVPIFNEHIKKWKSKEWAKLFKKIGAKYVVLTTKHCDGFLLWPSKYPNPNKENYIASRDIVGELTSAVKQEGMNMGFYYSSAWDWSFNLFPIKDTLSFNKHYVQTSEYAEYVTNHWYELIDRYQPKILWSDMGFPMGKNPYKIFADYYNQFPDGVVNDRWNQWLPEENKFLLIRHKDFTTPEYRVFKEIKKRKWETCRGIGNSFGYNQFESEEDYMSSKDLIYLLIDIVSKNGNLLLNVGPNADGKIPEIQEKRLTELGKWLEVNGDAIFGTRPWIRAESITTEDIPVRFTQKENNLYVILMGKPEKDEIGIKNLEIREISKINLLGVEENLKWRIESNNLIIRIPKKIKDSHAISFKIELSLNNTD
ncbi:MAG: alpha-L-fucosidase [Candidatus Lokiarchaeota archaeon]|nr:alpha-L-fucosidase [Candidatus Lokiarchaeota archaeon]